MKEPLILLGEIKKITVWRKGSSKMRRKREPEDAGAAGKEIAIYGDLINMQPWQKEQIILSRRIDRSPMEEVEAKSVADH